MVCIFYLTHNSNIFIYAYDIDKTFVKAKNKKKA